MKENVRALVLSPDNRFLISGSEDGTIKVFDIVDRVLFHRFESIHSRKSSDHEFV